MICSYIVFQIQIQLCQLTFLLNPDHLHVLLTILIFFFICLYGLLQARWAGYNYIVQGCEKLAHVFWKSLVTVTQQQQSQTSWWIYNASNWRCMLPSWFWRWGKCNGARHSDLPQWTCGSCRTGTEPVVLHVLLPPLVPEGDSCSSLQDVGSRLCGCLRWEPAGCCKGAHAGAGLSTSVPLVAGEMPLLPCTAHRWRRQPEVEPGLLGI